MLTSEQWEAVCALESTHTAVQPFIADMRLRALKALLHAYTHQPLPKRPVYTRWIDGTCGKRS